MKGLCDLRKCGVRRGRLQRRQSQFKVAFRAPLAPENLTCGCKVAGLRDGRDTCALDTQRAKPAGEDRRRRPSNEESRRSCERPFSQFRHRRIMLDCQMRLGVEEVQFGCIDRQVDHYARLDRADGFELRYGVCRTAQVLDGIGVTRVDPHCFDLQDERSARSPVPRSILQAPASSRSVIPIPDRCRKGLPGECRR